MLIKGRCLSSVIFQPPHPAADGIKRARKTGDASVNVKLPCWDLMLPNLFSSFKHAFTVQICSLFLFTVSYTSL